MQGRLSDKCDVQACGIRSKPWHPGGCRRATDRVRTHVYWAQSVRCHNESTDRHLSARGRSTGRSGAHDEPRTSGGGTKKVICCRIIRKEFLSPEMLCCVPDDTASPGFRTGEPAVSPAAVRCSQGALFASQPSLRYAHSSMGAASRASPRRLHPATPSQSSMACTAAVPVAVPRSGLANIVLKTGVDHSIGLSDCKRQSTNQYAIYADTTHGARRVGWHPAEQYVRNSKSSPSQ